MTLTKYQQRLADLTGAELRPSNGYGADLDDSLNVPDF